MRGFGENKTVLRVLQQHVAARHIAVGVLGGHLPQRVPGADIRPAGIKRHDDGRRHARLARGQRFHDGVVDRIRRAGCERSLVDAVEIVVGGAALIGGAAGRFDVRPETLQQGQRNAGLHHEDAGVPQIVAAGQIGLGRCRVGLLDKTVERARRATGKLCPGPDVAVAGFRLVRRDAEGDHCPGVSMGGAQRHRVAESGGVADHMIGRHDQQHRIGRAGGERSQRQRRRGVAPHRFEQQRRRLDVDLAQLFCCQETVFLVAYDERCGNRQSWRTGTQRGVLQQRALAVQRQQLLRIAFARQRPEAGAGAAAQDDGLQGHDGNLSEDRSLEVYVMPCGASR